MNDNISSETLDTFSTGHKRASWYILQLLASLPGLFLLIGFFIPAIATLAIFLIVLFGDPFLRKLITNHKLVRSIVLSTLAVYLVTALLYQYAPILALPFLVAAVCVFVIYFGRKAKRFESTVLRI